MPPLDELEQYAHAVLDHVQTGAYPDSEDIISADLLPSALPVISKTIKEAWEDLRRKVKEQSKEVAPDIDGWISRAKQLQTDIQASQEDAQDIAGKARHGRELRAQTADSGGKVRLLEEELAFNRSLEASLQQLRALGQQLDRIQQAILEDDVLVAVDYILDFEGQVPSVSSSPNSRVVAAFSSKATDLRTELAEKLQRYWKAHIQTDREKSAITFLKQSKDASMVDLDSVAQAMRKLGTFDQALLPFCRDIESMLLIPRLRVWPDGSIFSIEIEDDSVCSVGPSSDLSAGALFSELSALVDFLNAKSPPSAVDRLSGLLMPTLLSKLTTTWLASAVPEDLDGMEGFRDTVSLAQAFGNHLKAISWPRATELDTWIESIPVLWLRRRQESALNQVRKLLTNGVRSTKVVERVETQIISQDDDVFAGTSGGEDWNANWSDEEDAVAEASENLPTNNNSAEEDVSAWGFQEGNGNTQPREDAPSTEQDDGAEAWGWGDDDDQDSHIATKAPLVPKLDPKKAAVNGTQQKPSRTDREITLKEMYTITSLPNEILDLISTVTADLERLRSPEFAGSTLTGAVPALRSLPGLVLVMYRASSPQAYEKQSGGNMYLYNDCLWLAEQLRDSSSTKDPSVASSTAALETHGKRAYAKEMDSQRTILMDMLDGAEGFEKCTEFPAKQACDDAIASVIDRLRQLHREWKAVLSHSALLQALGSLLSSACSKIIMDVEEMEDISEPESQQLTQYCSRLGTLEEIFKPQAIDPSVPGSEEAVPLTAVYTKDWLKFQYLTNILESSLVDIKYMWTEGELQLEFETQELVDLIEALFAESPYRKGAIAEIRAAERSNR